MLSSTRLCPELRLARKRHRAIQCFAIGDRACPSELEESDRILQSGAKCLLEHHTRPQPRGQRQAGCLSRSCHAVFTPTDTIAALEAGYNRPAPEVGQEVPGKLTMGKAAHGLWPRAKVDEAEGSPSQGGANRMPAGSRDRRAPGKSTDQRMPSGCAITRRSFPPTEVAPTTLQG